MTPTNNAFLAETPKIDSVERIISSLVKRAAASDYLPKLHNEGEVFRFMEKMGFRFDRFADPVLAYSETLTHPRAAEAVEQMMSLSKTIVPHPMGDGHVTLTLGGERHSKLSHLEGAAIDYHAAFVALADRVATDLQLEHRDPDAHRTSVNSAKDVLNTVSRAMFA